MKTFLTENFLLETASAVRLYHEYAAELPILDYHCHLPPAMVAADWKFVDMTELWLAGDHYKWRAMRATGIPEELITGGALSREKFDAWARTVPQLLRNPLYHWTHLELRRPFGIDDVLFGPETAESVWRRTNERLAEPEFSARGIMRQMRVALICTTDDPIDPLTSHAQLASERKRILDDRLRTGGTYGHALSIPPEMLPTFRPDRAMTTDDPAAWNLWCNRLEAVTDMEICSLDAFTEAMRQRHQYFQEHGCRLSDHGMMVPPAADYTDAEIAAIFDTLRSGMAVDPLSHEKFASYLMQFFGELAAEKGWTMQIHLGVIRNNSSRLMNRIGPDAGADSMADLPIAVPLARMLDRLDRSDRLPRTILYNLAPAMNDVLATMIGNFQDGTIPGKLQYGSGWWFLDQLDGMERQLESLSNQGVLSLFVGMLTDSRSFLSYTRHEYFRRILCNLLGSDMERGRLPTDFQLIGGMVRNICWYNAVRYFGFNSVADL